MKNITPEEWKEKTSADKNAVILDVRTKEECAHGMLEGAKCLDLLQREKFMAEVEKMDKDKNYFVYCRSGQRSTGACLMMESVGFKNTYNLIGGISSWNGKLVY